MEKQKIKRHTEDIHISTSRYIKNKVFALVEDEEFPSASDIGNMALYKFLLEYEMEQRDISSCDILLRMLQFPEGKELFDKVMMEKKGSTDNETEIRETGIKYPYKVN